ncbi:MAG TPA: hypothetical protein VIM38_01120 [Alphaproteobacteria bacterium]
MSAALKHMTRTELRDYVAAQVANFFPDKSRDVRQGIDRDLDEAIMRVVRCIDGVRMWRAGEFDYLHSSQYTIFLYYLANTIWRNRQDERLATKLFYLNKALNGIDCFYAIDMPDIWFIGHSVGIVFARATYANYLAVYQNATVGKNNGRAPVLEEGVVLYPNSAIVGGCHVRARSYIGQGQRIVDADTPGDCLVYNDGPKLVFKKPKRNILAEDFFRLQPEGQGHGRIVEARSRVA